MNHGKLKALLRRRLISEQFVVQCDADTTPPHLAEHGMVCAIVTWVPERTDDGEIIDEGFHAPPPTTKDDKP